MKLQYEILEKYFEKLSTAYESSDQQAVSDILLDRHGVAEILQQIQITDDLRIKYKEIYDKATSFLQALILKRHSTNLIDPMRELAEAHQFDSETFEIYQIERLLLTSINSKDPLELREAVSLAQKNTQKSLIQETYDAALILLEKLLLIQKYSSEIQNFDQRYFQKLRNYRKPPNLVDEVVKYNT